MSSGTALIRRLGIGFVAFTLQLCALATPALDPGKWLLVTSPASEASAPGPKKYAFTTNTSGDSLKIYAGNRGGMWLRFEVSGTRPLSASQEAVFEYRIDNEQAQRFLGDKPPKGLRPIVAMVLPKHYRAENFVEITLGPASSADIRNYLLLQLVKGSVMTVRYETVQGDYATITFSLKDAADPIYAALNLDEAMKSGAISNAESYLSIQQAASKQCEQNAVRQNWTECMSGFNKCQTQHPSQANALAECARSSSTLRFEPR